MVWKIVKVTNNTSNPTQAIVMKDCIPIVGYVMSGNHRLIVGDLGYLDLLDIRGSSGWSWGIKFNGVDFYYEGEGQVSLTFENDGTFRATGPSMDIQGKLKPYYS